MLTADLLRYTRRQGRITPSLLDPYNGELQAGAAALIHLVSAHLGRRRGDLEAALRALRSPGVAPKTARGLAKLLLERCRFEVGAAADPPALRGDLFDEAARVWRSGTTAATMSWRAEVMRRVADKHGLSAPVAEAALFADLAENQCLAGWEAIAPQALLFRYNTAQVQGLLLMAERVQLSAAWPTSQRLRQLFRFLKFFRLLFQLEHSPPGGEGDRLSLTIDGPLSLLASGTRYGIDLAQFFPALLLWRQPWTLRAALRMRRGGPGHLQLAPHPWLRSHYPDQGQWVPRSVQGFVERFNQIGSRWHAAAAEDILLLPRNLCLVPDFVFREGQSGRSAFLEHVAYPVPGRLRARLQQITEAGRADYLLACRGVPSVMPLRGEAPFLLTYRRTLLPGPVLQALEALAP